MRDTKRIGFITCGVGLLFIILAGCTLQTVREGTDTLREAELALTTGRAPTAIELLTALSPRALPPELRPRYWGVLAAAYRFNGEPLPAAQQLIQRDELYAADIAGRYHNQLAIVTTLTGMSGPALERIARVAENETVRGWAALAWLLQAAPSQQATVMNRYQQWRATYKDHPALPELIQFYYAMRAGNYRPNTHVALLLPQRGRFGDASAAIRAGFMAADDANHVGVRPHIHSYDTQTLATYHTAAADSDVIVGPLEKSAVATIAAQHQLPVTTLALNRPTDDEPLAASLPNELTLFALSPEDEAMNAAQYVWASGRRAAVILAPQGVWGARLTQAFRNTFQALGGRVVRQQLYGATVGSYGAAVGGLLTGAPADVLFLVATQQTIEELWTAVTAANRTQLPVITTSHVYDGTDVTRDTHLRGLYFIDVPWVLPQAGNDPLAREQLAATTPRVTGAFTRLAAMGIDAYHVAPYIAALRADPGLVVSGVTGELSVNPQGVMQRQLALAQFTAAGVVRVHQLTAPAQ